MGRAGGNRRRVAATVRTARTGSPASSSARCASRAVAPVVSTSSQTNTETHAPDLANAHVAGLHGAALLANTFRDPELMAGQARRLERWIDSLTSGV